MTARLPTLALATFALAALTAPAARAQGAPVADALRKNEQRAGHNLVAAAEEMPEAKYGYKPTPSQLSFGEVISHLVQGNDYLCSKISGRDAPKRAELPKGARKDALVAHLRQSFDFCESALAKVDDSALNDPVPFFGGNNVSRVAAMMAAVEDWGDHYSQLAIYLRLNGHLPPTAKQKE